MPSMSDPLGAPQIVTGVEYGDMLARLGYNVENMTSSLPMISKIAQAGTSLLDSAYQHNLDYQKAQSDLALSYARADSLDTETDFNRQNLQNRLKEFELNNETKALALKYDTDTLATRENTLDLANKSAQQKLDFDKQYDPERQKQLEMQNQEMQSNLGLVQKSNDDALAAMTKWNSAYQDYPDVTDPDYVTKRAAWIDQNRDIITNPKTAAKANDLILRGDAANSSLAATQLKNDHVNQILQGQKEGRISPILDANKIAGTDEGQNQIIRANLGRTGDELDSAIAALPNVVDPRVTDLRARLTGLKTQISAYMGSDDQVQNIKKGGNINVGANGLARGDIAGTLNAAKALSDEYIKKGVVPPTVKMELPSAPHQQGARAQPMVTIEGTPEFIEQARQSPQLYSPMYDDQGRLKQYDAQGNEKPRPAAGQSVQTGAGSEAKQTQLSQAEQARSRAVAQAVVQANPQISALGEQYRTGKITREAFIAQLNQMNIAVPKGMQAGGIVPGVGDTDSVPAMLTPGEAVIPKDVVQNIGVPEMEAAIEGQSAGVPPPLPTEDQTPVPAPLQPESASSLSLRDPLTGKAPAVGSAQSLTGTTNLLSLSQLPQAPRAPAAGAVGAAEQQAQQYGGAQPAIPVAQAAGAVGAAQQQAKGYQSLAQTRSGFAQELANPDTRRLLMASTEAEVGDQSPQAQQAYMESVMNRAAARNTSLRSVLLDPHYYPSSTKNKLNAQMSEAQTKQYNPLIQQVLSGSNISNLGTGNESGTVRSGGAEITFNPGTGERFVAELPTVDWRQQQLAALGG